MLNMLKPLFAAAIMVLALLSTYAHAKNIGEPVGEIVLTVSGNLGSTVDRDSVQFDLAMLRQLEPVTFRTETIWTEGEQVFTGVPLKTLLETLGVKGGTLSAKAANDYAVDMPVSDALQDGPIVAYELNGKEMSLRNKGPLWIVYPYDRNRAFRTEVIYARSIWQLDRIEIVE